MAWCMGAWSCDVVIYPTPTTSCTMPCTHPCTAQLARQPQPHFNLTYRHSDYMLLLLFFLPIHPFFELECIGEYSLITCLGFEASTWKMGELANYGQNLGKFKSC